MVLYYFSTICFAMAMLHTFFASRFSLLAEKYREGSWQENALHLLGEVETVFGLWAAVFIIGSFGVLGFESTLQNLEAIHFSEPLFVFVILTVCSTEPILQFAKKLIMLISRLLPFSPNLSFLVSTLVLAPIIGSLITEPAAMTIGALLLLDKFFNKSYSKEFKYAVLGLLFVNVSIGGTLTHFAAPPVLMVATKWGWTSSFMLRNFGWKALFSIVVSTALVLFRFRREMLAKSQVGSLRTQVETLTPTSLDYSKDNAKGTINDPFKTTLPVPWWMIAIHLVFLAGIVLSSHHPVLFIGIFLFFLGLVEVTKEYQKELRLRQGLFVGFFLAGLVVLGGPQHWWLQPLISELSDAALYIGAIALTAVTDNAALTYLGSQVEGLSNTAQYALVSGAVVGGGLTVIANAPNPIGYSILNESLPEGGLNHLLLLKSAALPTLLTALIFWFL